MPERAETTSIAAIGDFRAALLVYIAKARPLADDAADEIRRTRDWLHSTQRLHWENQVRIRARALEDAEQALFSAELARLRAPSNAELMAVQKAKRALAEAEEKLRMTRRMASQFEKEAAPRLKQIENLRTAISANLQDGAHYLERVVQALDRYAEARLGPPAAAEPQPGEPA
jgi:hypothetical protein